MSWKTKKTFYSRRCENKKPYKNLKEAARRAEEQSFKCGELIIAYECYDCRKFHIGHADESQKIAFAQEIEKIKSLDNSWKEKYNQLIK